MSDTRSNHAPERSLGMVDVSVPTGEDNDEELCLLEVEVGTAAAMSSVRALDMASKGHSTTAAADTTTQNDSSAAFACSRRYQLRIDA